MGMLELLELYNIGEKDLEEIASLKPYFTDEFKKTLRKRREISFLRNFPTQQNYLKE
jgi:hypothetical protein